MKPTEYVLSVYKLDSLSAPADDLNFTSLPCLLSLDSSTPWPSITVGHSLYNGEDGELLGVVEQVAHLIGEFGETKNRVVTKVFLEAD